LIEAAAFHGVKPDEGRLPDNERLPDDGRGPSVFAQPLSREKRLGEAESGQVTDSPRVENAVEMIAFVLHDAGMKVGRGAVNRLAIRIVATVSDMAEARHPASHSGHRQATFPALLLVR
jgi:hypothetical protein